MLPTLEAGSVADLHKNLKIPFSASSPGPQAPWIEDGKVGIDTSNRLALAAPPASFALNCDSVLVSLCVLFSSSVSCAFCVFRRS